MSNKNEKKSKFPLAAAVFGVAAIACTVVRFFQYKNVISVETGFFEHDGGFLAHAYYALFAAFLAVLLVIAVIDNKSRRGIMTGRNFKPSQAAEMSGEAKKPPNRKTGNISAVVGLILLCGTGLLLAFEAVYWLNRRDEVSLSLIIALFAASLGYTYAAFTVISQKKIIPTTAVSFLFIAAYNVAAAVAVFQRKIYLYHVSAELLALLTSIVFSLFFLSCGRIIVRGESRFTVLSSTVFGYSAVLLALSDGLARFFYYFSLNAEKANTLISAGTDNGFDLPSPLYFAQAAAIIWLIFALSAKKNDGGAENPEETEENSESEENNATNKIENEENENIDKAPKTQTQTRPDAVGGGIAD